MLKIKTGSGLGQVHEWKKGQPLPMNKVNMGSYKLTNIVEVSADGEELAYIYARFSYLPQVADTCAVYPQPWAQFIYDNLV